MTVLQRKPVEKSIWGDGIYIEFHDREVKVPVGVVDHLKSEYGEDYMKMPPESKQRPTHTYSYDRAWTYGVKELEIASRTGNRNVEFAYRSSVLFDERSPSIGELSVGASAVGKGEYHLVHLVTLDLINGSDREDTAIGYSRNLLEYGILAALELGLKELCLLLTEYDDTE